MCSPIRPLARIVGGFDVPDILASVSGDAGVDLPAARGCAACELDGHVAGTEHVAQTPRRGAGRSEADGVGLLGIRADGEAVDDGCGVGCRKWFELPGNELDERAVRNRF